MQLCAVVSVQSVYTHLVPCYLHLPTHGDGTVRVNYCFAVSVCLVLGFTVCKQVGTIVKLEKELFCYSQLHPM